MQIKQKCHSAGVSSVKSQYRSPVPTGPSPDVTRIARDRVFEPLLLPWQGSAVYYGSGICSLDQYLLLSQS